MNRFKSILIGGALVFGPAAFAAADTAPPQPALFLPEVLEPEGRFTLTPGFTPDGQTMFFAQTECLPIWECPQRLKRIDRTPAGWTTPRLVPLPQEGRVDYPSVTPDGRYLLFSWAAVRPDYPEVGIDINFDLWRLDLTKAGAEPELLEGPDLNRIRAGRVKTLRFVNNETAPILTEAGDLYFWTERLDGAGERDVYLARGDGNGGFQAPEPLPAPINSAGRDDGAWVSADGTLMLITYADRGGCGGNDLFISRKADGVWSEPRNLGCSVNSAHDDGAGALIPGTQTLVFMSSRPLGNNAPGTPALWVVNLNDLEGL
jgi:hypothetical protein